MDVVVANTKFWAYWKSKKYKKALSVYYRADRPFWLADTVGHYYEHRGQLKNAMREYEYLINAYLKIRKDFLPLPKGPPELYKVGKWYAFKNKAKARKYLELYLNAEDKCKGDPAFFLWHKNAARKLLNKLETERV